MPAASTAHQSEAIASEPTTPASGPYSIGNATSQLRGGAESKYSARYAVVVEAASQDGLQVKVDFNAVGESDLRRPETSCLVINGSDGKTYLARPISMWLTTDEPGNFAGHLTFPAIVSGSYGLQYSCADDYSTAEIGSVHVPSLGISRFSENYYAVVFGFEGHIVQFAVHGQYEHDLRDPVTSCVTVDGKAQEPSALETKKSAAMEGSDWSPDAVMISGSITYPADVQGGHFVYSCSEYTEVPLV